MNALVSILIPAYNAARFVERALQSATAQTHQNLEIIVVDDGSRDGTAKIVKGVNDTRITYIYQDNAGPGSARNTALRRCRGEYVSFLDADDYYHPRKIERQLDFLKTNPRYKIVYCNALHVYADRPHRIYKKKDVYRSGRILPELLTSSYVNPNAVLVAREVFERIGGFVETRYYPEEWDLWLRMTLAGFEFGYLDEDLVTVEIREGSNTTMEIQPIAKRYAITMFEKLLPAPMFVDGVVCSAARAVRSLRPKLALACLANGQRQEFAAELAQMLGRGPWTHLVACGLMITPRWVVRRLWRVNQLRNSVVAGRS